MSLLLGGSFFVERFILAVLFLTPRPRSPKNAAICFPNNQNCLDNFGKERESYLPSMKQIGR